LIAQTVGIGNVIKRPISAMNSGKYGSVAAAALAG
jgi:hypothetical protein